MLGHAPACSGMPGMYNFRRFRCFEKEMAKIGKKFGIFCCCKMLDFGLLDANLRGFEAPFFKIFSSRRAPLAGGDRRALECATETFSPHPQGT